MKNLAGKIFGRLTALESTDNRSSGSVVWKCRCDCGEICFVRSGSLRSGNTKSCGCLHIERKTTHGLSLTPEYHAWASMKARCSNPNHKHYKNYGGRGIQVCERWLKLENFLEDMGERPGREYSIDRINNDGNYELSNCRWVTAKEQANNRRVAKDQKTLKWFYGYGPEGQMIVDNNQCKIARVFDLSPSHVSNCLHGKLNQHKGWKFKCI